MSVRWLAVSLVLAFPAAGLGQNDPSWEDAELDTDPPDEDWVWEDGYQRPDGTVVEGFYRPRARAGFEWAPGHVEGQVWVDPQWRWTGAQRQGYVLVPGRVGPDGYWIPESWRPATVAGQVWVDGHLEGNFWIPGHFQPVTVRAGYAWEPGYYSPTGEWVDGNWREQARADYVWVAGGYRFGVWTSGYWRPRTVRAGYVWVPGRWTANGWVEGQWRERRRPGNYWVHGHWQGGVWVPGAWVAGTRPGRRWVVRPVRDMWQARRAHIQRVRVGAAVQARGRALEHRGRVMERRGERLERAGEATGNERMERRGEALQNRGEHMQNRGNVQQNRGRRIRRGR